MQDPSCWPPACAHNAAHHFCQWHCQATRRYLLCKPDIPWQPDPQRENPSDRDRLYARYEAELTNRGCLYSICEGSAQARLAQALAAIEGVG